MFKRRKVHLHDHVTKFFLLLLLLLMIVVAPMCTGLWVMFCVSDAGCLVFNKQTTSFWVPVWVAPVQEDEDHIPFFCLRMFSEKFHDFSEFQWDPVRFLTSLHGFVVSLNRLHVSSVLVLVMWAEILSWGQLDPSTDLGLLCSFSLIRKLVIPVKIKVNYVWMPA